MFFLWCRWNRCAADVTSPRIGWSLHISLLVKTREAAQEWPNRWCSSLLFVPSSATGGWVQHQRQRQDSRGRIQQHHVAIPLIIFVSNTDAVTIATISDKPIMLTFLDFFLDSIGINKLVSDIFYAYETAPDDLLMTLNLIYIWFC